jgi:septum formation protein
LLAAAGYDFEIVVPSTPDECGACSRVSPAELVLQIAFDKAKDVARQVLARGDCEVLSGAKQPRGGLVLACDTLAEVEGQILGKPDDEAHARRMLELLRGREHRVLSGICLWDVPAGIPDLRVAVTKLKMDAISDAQLNEYLASGLWADKAGAFGYQDGWDWLHVRSGSESNVVGLPLEMLAEMIAKWQVEQQLIGTAGQ